jgi:hypothetical protein
LSSSHGVVPHGGWLERLLVGSWSRFSGRIVVVDVFSVLQEMENIGSWFALNSCYLYAQQLTIHVCLRANSSGSDFGEIKTKVIWQTRELAVWTTDLSCVDVLVTQQTVAQTVAQTAARKR